MSKIQPDRYSELAQFLRNRRARLSPKQLGLPEGRRRTPGLRRGEVAALAGISLEWYTYLEQGRQIHVSAEVLESLARTLRLDDTERKHLFLLAHRQLPPERSRSQEGRVSAVIQRHLDSLGTSPASVLDARMNIIAWNAAFAAVHGDNGKLPEGERNFLWITFTSKAFRSIKGDQWEDHAKRTIAKFRAGFAKYVDDPWWAEQVERLSEASAEFKEYWQQYDVLDAQDAHKILNHPEVGLLMFVHLTLQPLESPDLEISVHVPLDDDTVKKIRSLLDKQGKSIS
ncbi:helix-turn-helix transcriptional regulator [Paenibacillus hamazuiensis]|uniref:helix-turn-helix transcriptional regulator n=1 Tax=Paenibacillus hamazuiensis TaxID=2936508 RepID=UPI00200E165E|nr:helix-turn-helix transcriptional regulator [Paenibacillus hamazuiensis]